MTDKILDPIDTDREIKAVYSEVFDTSVASRKQLGSIPPEVHGALTGQARERGMQVGEYLASLLKFRKDYETEYDHILTEQRDADAVTAGGVL